MAKKKNQPAKPLVPQVPLTPAVPPPDNPLLRGMGDEPRDPADIREEALARLKALDDAKRMENRPESD